MSMLLLLVRLDPLRRFRRNVTAGHRVIDIGGAFVDDFDILREAKPPGKVEALASADLVEPIRQFPENHEAPALAGGNGKTRKGDRALETDDPMGGDLRRSSW